MDKTMQKYPKLGQFSKGVMATEKEIYEKGLNTYLERIY